MKITDYIYKGNIKYKQDDKHLSIRIPMKRSFKTITLLFLATLAWSVALFFGIYLFLKINSFWVKSILILGFLSWTVVGLIGSSIFMWMFFGRERIVLTQEYLITEKPLVFFYRRSFYITHEVHNIKVDNEIYNINRNGSWLEKKRIVLKFDTKTKTSIFARNIDMKDAEFVLFLLAKSKFLNENQFAVVQ